MDESAVGASGELCVAPLVSVALDRVDTFDCVVELFPW